MTTATAVEARPLDMRLKKARSQAMTAVSAAALGFTAIAYLNMVPFLRDDLGWPAAVAWTLGGVFEVALIGMGLMARWAALDGQPIEKFLTWTWLFAALSGAFAAVHMLNAGKAWGPVLFAFAVPLVAALVWHFALGMEVKAVKGIDWKGRREQRREKASRRKGERLVRAYARACQRTARLEAARAQDNDHSHATHRLVEKAHAHETAAQDAAIDVLGVEEFEKRLKKYAVLFEASKEHSERLRATFVAPAPSAQAPMDEQPQKLEQTIERVDAPHPTMTVEPNEADRRAPHTASTSRSRVIRGATPQERRTVLPDDAGTNAEIKNMKAVGKSNAEVGRTFGVDASTISRRLKKLDASVPKTPHSGIPIVAAKELVGVG